MALRGALNPGFNLLYTLILVGYLSWWIYFGYEIDAFEGSEFVALCVAFPVGLLVGIPAYILNRKALSELAASLDNKIVLSSQLGLLDSHQGRNAVVYYYCAMAFALLAQGAILPVPGISMCAFGCGAYVSAHLLPFVVPPKTPAPSADLFCRSAALCLLAHPRDARRQSFEILSPQGAPRPE
jgi:hypothetical protein